ncbi:MAG: CopG family transcriptional regulator [Candidatus Heimdallarchaeota archaeon]
MVKEKKFTAVLIPTPLFKEIEERIKGTDFATVSNYVAYMLREIIAEQPSKELFTREDEERVKERLKRLGYL